MKFILGSKNFKFQKIYNLKLKSFQNSLNLEYSHSLKYPSIEKNHKMLTQPSQLIPPSQSTTVNLQTGRVPGGRLSSFISISNSMQRVFSMCEMKRKSVPLTNLVACRNPRPAKKRTETRYETLNTAAGRKTVKKLE